MRSYYFIFIYLHISLVGRVFANGPERLEFNPRSSQTKTQKMVLDNSLPNAQHYKVRIEGKIEQSRERSVEAIEKGAFGRHLKIWRAKAPFSIGINIIYIMIYIVIYIMIYIMIYIIIWYIYITIYIIIFIIYYIYIIYIMYICI